MWIFTSKGFYSIVIDETIPGNLLVRARFKGHIKKLLPKQTVHTTPQNDYLYRTSVPRAIVMEAISKNIEKIDYPNFKNSVQDNNFASVCSKVWTVMFNAQHNFLNLKKYFGT